ncbi:MAG TPA: acyl-CoA dehydrogenase family protein [Frankiaceae bacterium]|nr:acyl-CoA dehydrogenase family protein [Frankiaceae bacterium]
MDLSLDEMAQAAVDAVNAVCVGQSPPGRPSWARDAEPLGHDPKLWAELCAIGLPGLAVPEEQGGGGADLLALTAVAQQLGTVLAPAPFNEHAVAVRLLARLAPNHPDLEAAVCGELIVTLAPRVTDGIALVVPAGAVADVVIGCDSGELVAVRSEPPREALPNQGNLPIADRDLRSGERVVLATGLAAPEAFEDASDEWLTLVAGWLAGLSSGALEVAVRWVKDRQQFGVAIGSFQAVAHGLADIPGQVDGSTLLAREAAWSLSTGLPSTTGANGTELALMALLFASDTAHLASAKLVQYHGGLGVAEEHDAQLFYRRARAYPLVTGAPRAQLRELGKAVVTEFSRGAGVPGGQA